MNFLAHIFLSGRDPEIKVGNFVADWIKGSDHNKYAPQIQKGIIIHRSIDSFTDNHPIIRKSKTRFTPQYGKYAGIIIDILYDHYLATEWNRYHKLPLSAFAQETYDLLITYRQEFPEGVRQFIPQFIRRRWLETYASVDGIKNVLTGMSRHTSLPDHTEIAIHILKLHYEDFKDEFLEYFPLLIAHVEDNFGITILPEGNDI